MHALVVFESMYGNTAAIAVAIGDGLRGGGMKVDVVPVDAAVADRAAQCDLLVVGGPTHMHGMSRTSTRNTAAKDGNNTYDSPTVTPGIRTWLGDLPEGRQGSAAAFDTRLHGAKALTGSAAKGIGHEIQRRGYRLVIDPESFIVTKDNTLVDGELERAEAWGSHIAEVLSVATTQRN